ncbi:MAG: hypothetical protein Q7U98_19710 [Methylicorpusculum sp.]|uniref:hypothetical protein n=1 Tax=Methylicorpusculum sp. TaxID=2713644 RepID=UPI0027177383|nr:hypothetical protein [Methylicorpusculum sp.]MDO8941389.1 hypothetical protein [Methylicorpusculum sp.]MDP2203020.1 hypothetical protein [Methylicorpusculum sp.]
MNILWIEDFGGGLSTGTATLNLMFQDLISFDNWDEDELKLLDEPSDLENFFKDNSALHCAFLCRHYYDYVEFKENNNLLSTIDAVIIDIRLDHNVNFDLPVPNDSQYKERFHTNAGFYIFNDLVHLGFPSEKMCFMTGEKNSFTDFKTKCHDIYMPEVVGFEKSNAEYGKLRCWIKDRQPDYVTLRRGVIKGCEFLKSHIQDNDDNIQFRDFIKLDNNQLNIEIPTTEIENYLDATAQLLVIRKPPNSSALNIQYRLFLRTLVHEWEENIEADSLKKKYGNDLSKIRDIYTFAWLMKMTRNWVSHANLLEPLDPQIIAFLFLVNMRAMFKLPKAIQPYEHILLRCINLYPANDFKQLNDNIDHVESDVDGILSGWNINQSAHFGKKINEIYRRNTGNPDAEEHDFKRFLLQYFWVNQKRSLSGLTVNTKEFLPTLARHIYSLSFK